MFQEHQSFCSSIGLAINALITFTDKESDNMFFILNESIMFNDGKGKTDKAVYLGPLIDQGVLKHKIEWSNGIEYFVDREHLYSLNLPDVSIIPASVK